MQYANNKRRTSGINYVSDTAFLTLTTAPSAAIPIPEDATHMYCVSFQSSHNVGFGTSDTMPAPGGLEYGWRVNSNNNTPVLIPLDPNTTHFRVRPAANNTANRFVYAFLSLEKGVPIVL